MTAKVDSALSFEDAFAGKRVPQFIRRHLSLLNIDYFSFDGQLHRGQIIVNAALADEVQEIFAEILSARFPIETVIPVCAFAWNDDLSMAANNSSGFNPRRVAGTRRKSLHAAGRAIDINPVQNPWEHDGLIEPPGAVYNPAAPGTLTEDSAPVVAFLSRGWEWGGHWATMKDWHHFQKAL
jgi:peptidoglycan LD-endopeptidase CwlK